MRSGAAPDRVMSWCAHDRPVGIGTWIAYVALVVFFVAIALPILRTLLIFSLLWLQPLAQLPRRVPVLRRFISRPHVDGAAP